MIHAQIAPASRVAYGELLGEPPGDWTAEIAAATRQLGAEILYDTPLGADAVAYLEAKAFLTERVITSCCVGWRLYAQRKGIHFCPIVPPQMATGAIIKHFFEKDGPIWSVMPCKLKPLEMNLRNRAGEKLVDRVIFTKDLPKTRERSFVDYPASPKGMGFGATGGVLNAVLGFLKDMGEEVEIIKRTRAAQKEEVVIKLNGRTRRMLRVWGLANIDTSADFLEVMACPYGCVGGGGQPPAPMDTVRRRADAMREIAARQPERPHVKKILRWLDDLSQKEKEQWFYLAGTT